MVAEKKVKNRGILNNLAMKTLKMFSLSVSLANLQQTLKTFSDSLTVGVIEGEQVPAQTGLGRRIRTAERKTIKKRRGMVGGEKEDGKSSNVYYVLNFITNIRIDWTSDLWEFLQ